MTRFAWMCSHEIYQPEELLEQARLAEEVGFDAVVSSDVFHPWVDDPSAAGFAWSWLGSVAALTSHVTLVTTATSPLFRYHPAVIAQAAATMDRLSEGRFVLGVGTGDLINDAPLGWRGIGYGERAERLREAVEIIRRLWAGEKMTLEGRYYRLDNARLYSPPLRPVQLWMAADGPRSAALAGRIADGLITSVKDPKASLGRVVEPFRRAAVEQGHADLPVLATRWCVLAGSEEEAWEALGPLRGMRVPGRGQAVDPEILRRRADALGREEVLGQYTIVRDAGDLVAAYLPLVEDLEADYVAIQVATVDPRGAIQLVGAEVIPALDLRGAGDDP